MCTEEAIEDMKKQMNELTGELIEYEREIARVEGDLSDASALQYEKDEISYSIRILSQKIKECEEKKA